jgi:hypothetical protein
MKAIAALRTQRRCSPITGAAGKPFQHETRLMELLAKQDELNRALDLDRGERKVAPEETASPTLLKNCLHPCGLRRGRQVRRGAGGAYTNGIVMFSLVIKFEPVNWFDGVTC